MQIEGVTLSGFRSFGPDSLSVTLPSRNRRPRPKLRRPAENAQRPRGLAAPRESRASWSPRADRGENSSALPGPIDAATFPPVSGGLPLNSGLNPSRPLVRVPR